MPQEFSDSPARRPGTFPIGPLTVVLIAISIGVAILSRLGDNEAFVERLFISREMPEAGQWIPPEVWQGQVWRLLTPIFLHFGILHVVFNLLWLKDLGTVVEKRTSTSHLLALVLVIGVASNLAQYAYSGPFFGGMSGVVYGLLGFVWMKSRFDPASGFYLDRQTVLMMIGWFVLCLVNVIPHVANGAHAAGLGVGIVWGFISAKTRPRSYS